MIEYTDTVDKITPDSLDDFFQGWKRRYSPAEHLEILKSSAHIVLAVDTDKDRVVGFITALTDAGSNQLSFHFWKYCQRIRNKV